MTVAVITSSIGRPELRQTIESVKYQSYKDIQHYVFVNGPEWHDRAREILKDYPEVAAFYLPTHSGDDGAGPGSAQVFAGAPWLTNKDLIFFLNDDDYYDIDHVAMLVKLIKDNELDWAYSLRKFVDKDGIICEDNFDSLGFWPCSYNEKSYLVDNSCYAIKRKVARKFGHHWIFPVIGDRKILHEMKIAGLRSGCTGQYSVNYRTGGSAPPRGSDYYNNNLAQEERYKDGFPWRRQTVFEPGPKKIGV